MSDLTFRSSKTEVREGRIHGRGLFAEAAIAQGEIVAVKGGDIVSTERWTELEPELGPAEIQIAEDLFIAPVHRDHREGCMLYSNHSCEPNIGIQRQIAFVAMRAITAGEELTDHWATTDDQDYEMKCNCGTRSCRGVITGKDWMRKDLQEKYKGWFCWFLQRKIVHAEGTRQSS